MVIERGSIWWADLGEADGHRPAKRRPVLVVQSDPYNQSRLGTTIIATITSNLESARKPGNVLLPSAVTGLTRDSVVNVSQIMTVNKYELHDPMSKLPVNYMREVDHGLRGVMGLFTVVIG
ncbi:MAG: type II toxin-antitoxin system PemK/MazF family toxin [Propionibacteriaceae bacterium]|jgi:mRNA interferase MazF|nr:type II toxin-antitoxin system PemK/MazF family toxin [Propionibacteriaceae bacterium]